jgi:predicted HicB family RNase H-like nuclease
MSQLTQRSTVYFDPQMHKALRLKAAQENRSVSDIVNEAVALLASEDAEDIADLDSR